MITIGRVRIVMDLALLLPFFFTVVINLGEAFCKLLFFLLKYLLLQSIHSIKIFCVDAD